jgi:aspartate aminotransferase
VNYSATVGCKETNDAFLHIINAGGFDTAKLFCQITDGGSQAMELMILGVCGEAGKEEKPLMMIDAAYTNYNAFAERVGRKTVSVTRTLGDNGKFSLPKLDEIEETIRTHQPGGLVVIPYDNPTGQLYDKHTLLELAKLCVKYNMWMISDEAYRELFYVDTELVSIWGITDKEVPGIEGRRISIETASKVWNACGLRIGAIVTDNEEFHKQSIAEYTANLCANTIGQYIFGAMAHETKEAIANWCSGSRKYYKHMMSKVSSHLKELEPELIVSSPDAAIYSVIDVRNVAKPGFDAVEFVMYCAKEGVVDCQGTPMTLLVAPMTGFYDVKPGKPNPGKTQMRIAYVDTPENMDKVPKLFVNLFRQFEAKRL